jgi:hypothetical protein
MTPPKAPGTNYDLPPRKTKTSSPDLEELLKVELVVAKTETTLLKVQAQLSSLWDEIEAWQLREAQMVKEVAELRAKLKGSLAPSKSRKWTLMGTLLAGCLTALGAMGSAWLNGRSSAMTKAQQTELVRQQVLEAVKSSEASYRAGITEGEGKVLRELREELKHRQTPMGQMPVLDVRVPRP